jgi:FtsZ-binding cell division protein ZapB
MKFNWLLYETVSFTIRRYIVRKALFRALSFDCKQYIDSLKHTHEDIFTKICESDVDRIVRLALELEEVRGEVADLAEAFAEIEEQREDVEAMAQLLEEDGLSHALCRIVMRVGILAASEAAGIAVPDFETIALDSGNETETARLREALTYVNTQLARNASQANEALASCIAVLKGEIDALSAGREALAGSMPCSGQRCCP